MVAFELHDFKDIAFLKGIISTFLDKNFNKLSDTSKLSTLEVLDNFIHKYTGLQKIKLTSVNIETNRIAYLTNLNDRILDDQVIVINLDKSANADGPRILISYLKEKYRQYQTYSVTYGNEHLTQKQLDEWKYGEKYTKVNKQYFKNKPDIYNPLERDAYIYELKQLMFLIENFTDKKTPARVVRSLKKKRDDVFEIIKDIEDNKHRTEDIIRSVRRQFYNY